VWAEGGFAECGVEPVPEGLPRSGKGVTERSAKCAITACPDYVAAYPTRSREDFYAFGKRDRSDSREP